MLVLGDFYKVLDSELKACGEKDMTKEEVDALFMNYEVCWEIPWLRQYLR